MMTPMQIMIESVRQAESNLKQISNTIESMQRNKWTDWEKRVNSLSKDYERQYESLQEMRVKLDEMIRNS